MSTKQQLFWVGVVGFVVGAGAGTFGTGALVPAAVGVTTMLVLAVGSGRLTRPIARLAGPGSGSETARIAARISGLEAQLGVAAAGLEAVAASLSTGSSAPYSAWYARGATSGPTPALLERVLRGSGAERGPDPARIDMAGQLGHQAEGALLHLERMGRDLDELSKLLGTARSGAQQVEETVERSQRGADETQAELERMRGDLTSLDGQLRESSEFAHAMASVTKRVQDIAFRTNLAAINASVEAGRAGPQGHGFASVAREIQILSERCASAARETAEVLDVADQAAMATTEMAGAVLEGVHRIEGTMGQLRAELSELRGGVDRVEEELESGSSWADSAHAHAERLCRDLQEIEIQGREAAAMGLPPDPEVTRDMAERGPDVEIRAPAAFVPSALGDSTALDTAGLSSDGLTFDLAARAPPESGPEA